ncbi:auxin efflux carrier [Pseudomassariella vexata]|uniref:Auxin efflux carrier n=1 Tax=Pseudomassariella vexata TaxID=1141098 RepID=A0A1Y2E870_9PEZI|nr:auxin efflux carrier [Pseudomassariella vexata]ORY67750.1 auxin efflux carrier [Pseudomassariella vexata]
MPSFEIFKKVPHESHPSFLNLIILVFGAVLEVVCVSLPGYVIARLGHFDAEKQKFLANLNVMLFTPCLIFTKLASQLNADKLVELGVIPVIFIVQTLVSYFVSIGVSKICRLKKRPANFVTAMGVFGNSNSLPISLVISLSQTLKGLHWDKVKGDNDDEVAARGILYLMIFQQLGQLVRWSWGYHVLLAPRDKQDDEWEQGIEDDRIEEGRYRDNAPLTTEDVLIPGLDGSNADDAHRDESDESDVYEPAGRTPVVGTSRASPADSEDESHGTRKPNRSIYASIKKRSNGVNGTGSSSESFGLPVNGPDSDMMSFPRMRESNEREIPDGIRGHFVRAKFNAKKSIAILKRRSVDTSSRAYQCLPRPMQAILAGSWSVWICFYHFLWEFMNPPLWAMLIAIIVASVPDLQRLFFREESFVKTSVTSAISSSAGVAVPLILVVLGANLARNTQNRATTDPEEEQIGTRLLVASLLSRMVLPTLIMAPVIALFAKYVPVSILDDPIFVIVCFLLTGAPSALQLAQICQINGVYEGVMGKILFQSYVIWILPSTLILVMLALETVEWAK